MLPCARSGLASAKTLVSSSSASPALQMVGQHGQEDRQVHTDSVLGMISLGAGSEKLTLYHADI